VWNEFSLLRLFGDDFFLGGREGFLKDVTVGEREEKGKMIEILL